MKTIYVVLSGDYDEYQNKPIAAFESKDDADEFAEKCYHHALNRSFNLYNPEYDIWKKDLYVKLHEKHKDKPRDEYEKALQDDTNEALKTGPSRFSDEYNNWIKNFPYKVEDNGGSYLPDYYDVEEVTFHLEGTQRG